MSSCNGCIFVAAVRDEADEGEKFVFLRTAVVDVGDLSLAMRVMHCSFLPTSCQCQNLFLGQLGHPARREGT